MSKELKFAPRAVFDQMLEYMVIPTFDLVIEYGQQGIIMVRRTIAPYQHQWALPGLRMLKGENIDDTLRRIARQEVGLTINPRQKVLLGSSWENSRPSINGRIYQQATGLKYLQRNLSF